MSTTGNQHLKDIFKTVLSEKESSNIRVHPPPPSIYIKGDRNVIMIGGTMHVTSLDESPEAPPR